MSEAALWTYTKGKLTGSGDIFLSRHEDSVTLGVPDVSFAMDNVNGWLELKHLPEWPKRDTTVVKMKRYTEEQRKYILESGEHGGRSYLLLQVGKVYLLFGHWGAQLVGKVPRTRLEAIAIKTWTDMMDPGELRSALLGSSNDKLFVQSVIRRKA